jgi:NAD(P)-dependent dehydrogenase (short-subunit alcohol dehydrogenase family)
VEVAIDLSGKVAAVVGGTGGWGRGVSVALAEHGAAVLVNGREPTRIDEVVNGINSSGGRAVGLSQSVVSLEEARRVVTAGIEAFGSVDIVVNCAGVQTYQSLLDTSWEQVQEVIDIELLSAFASTKAAAEHMVESGHGGTIITIGGAAGIYGLEGGSGHAAAKGGVNSATWGWARELQPHGITVNNVRGGVVSGLTQPNIERQQRDFGTTAEDLGFFDGRQSASVIVWLASEEARDITGFCLGIDGPKITIWEPKAPDTELWTVTSWDDPAAIGRALGSALRHRPPILKSQDLIFKKARS